MRWEGMKQQQATVQLHPLQNPPSGTHTSSAPHPNPPNPFRTMPCFFEDAHRGGLRSELLFGSQGLIPVSDVYALTEILTEAFWLSRGLITADEGAFRVCASAWVTGSNCTGTAEIIVTGFEDKLIVHTLLELKPPSAGQHSSNEESFLKL